MSERNNFLVFIRGLLPLKTQLKIEYRIKCGRRLDLNNPTRYTEKMQMYKYKYRNPLMVDVVDKIKVVEYLKQKGLEHLIVPKLGIYNRYEDIDFSILPNSFVIKSNNGSGNNYIVQDKGKIDHKQLRKLLKKWMNNNTRQYGTEWVYKEVKPKILIEEMLPLDERSDLPDYKFFCFNGKVEYIYVMKDYVFDHNEGKLNFYDRDFNKLPYGRKDFPHFDEDEISKPKNYNEMIKYAEILSKDFPHVRVDFYIVEDKIYFGELTFFTLGGYLNFEPDEFDFIMGEKFILNVDK